MGAFVEGMREDIFIERLEPSVGFENGPLQDVLGCGVGVEGLALLDADGFELVNHGAVALEPWLRLDDAIERLEEAHVVGNGCVEDYVDRSR